ncbi:MAG: acyl-CoA dehydrogenase family protein, partial [Blastocatellia bacterium]
MSNHRSSWMNEDLEIFRRSVRQFLQEEFVPHDDKWRAQHRVDREAWTKAGAMGILLTDVAEEYGGG